MTALSPFIRYKCPHCGSRDVRISGEIYCTVKPNDERDPIENYQFLDFDVEWEDCSDAWCKSCGWDGDAGGLAHVLPGSDMRTAA